MKLDYYFGSAGCSICFILGLLISRVNLYASGVILGMTFSQTTYYLLNLIGERRENGRRS